MGFYGYITKWLYVGRNLIGSSRKPTKPIEPTKTNRNILLDFYRFLLYVRLGLWVTMGAIGLLLVLMGTQLNCYALDKTFIGSNRKPIETNKTNKNQ